MEIIIAPIPRVDQGSNEIVYLVLSKVPVLKYSKMLASNKNKINLIIF